MGQQVSQRIGQKLFCSDKVKERASARLNTIINTAQPTLVDCARMNAAVRTDCANVNGLAGQCHAGSVPSHNRYGTNSVERRAPQIVG